MLEAGTGDDAETPRFVKCGGLRHGKPRWIRLATAAFRCSVSILCSHTLIRPPFVVPLSGDL